MTTASTRRQAAIEAIDSVRNGTRAAEAETETVDFKLEAGVTKGPKHYGPIPPRDERAAKALAIEATCFANSEEGGVLVVGVDDDGSGASAFIGTYLDVGWLRKRISEITQPHLSVDEIEILTVEGQRIYLIDVPSGLAQYGVDGRVRGRRGTECLELTGDDARRLLERRVGHDWSSGSSGLRASDASADALRIAKRLYQERRGSTPPDLDLLRQMGVLAGDGDDPELNLAGALLLCPLLPGVTQIDVRVVAVEGTIASPRLEEPAPMLLSFARVWEVVTRAFPVASTIVGAVRREARAIPEAALREALINAIAHRDYELSRSPIVAFVIGSPATSFKIESPGLLPHDLRPEKLISTQSRPRNPALFNAMRTLGLGEREGVGIDLMYRSMVRDGHRTPEFTQSEVGVVCRLDGGPRDPTVTNFFDEIETRDRSLADNTRVVLAISHFLDERYLREEQLAQIAQSTHREAGDAISALVALDICEPVPKLPKTFRLTAAARQRLASRLSYALFASADSRWVDVRAILASNGTIATSDVANMFRMHPTQASRLLKKYVEKGLITRATKGKTGRGVRYKLTRLGQREA